jgi:UTP:GlnB (protein PII) uridylyltransferase
MEQTMKKKYDIRLMKEQKTYRLLFQTGENRIGMLYKIAAVLYVQNWNIREMNALTREDGIVDDFFIIEPMEKRIPYIMEYSLVSGIEKLLHSDLTVMKFVSKFPKKLKTLHKANREGSGKVSVEEIQKGVYSVSLETHDRPGLIFEITQALYRLYFDIVRMDSTTIAHLAYDQLIVVRDPEKKSKKDALLLKEALDKVLV